MASLSSPAQAAPTAAVAATAPQVSQLYEFSYPISVQNLVALPNGCLLLSTSANADLHYIDPEALYPAAQKVATLPDTTALTGFAALGDGFYAVSGGGAPSNADKKDCADGSSSGGLQVYVVKVDTEGDVKVTVDHSIAVPDTSSMEGMAALPAHARTVLSADAIGGRILRIDTDTNTVDVAFENDALKPGDGAAHRGVTGIKIRDDHLYFTNAAKGTFGRFPIDADGAATGDVEILAHLDGTDSYGDFGFDAMGNAFVAVHPSSVHKITPAGAQSVFAGGANSTFLGPTSAVVSNDGKSIYVSTAGENTGFPISGGQVMKVQV